MPAGRKSKYQPEFVEIVEDLAKKGYHDFEIYEQLKISHNAFYNYLKENNEFSEALKRGRLVCVQQVEKALFQRAKGYDYEEKTTEVQIKDNGETKPVSVKTVKKHVPADMGAIAFYLKNKASDDWRDSQHIDHSNKDGTLRDVKVTIVKDGND